MKVLKRIFSYKALLIILGVLVLVLLSSRFINFSASDEEILEAFANAPFKPESHFVKFEKGNLHYVTIGDRSKKTLILIHGSPGSWDAWMSFCTDTEILKKYFIIAIDRPGYNKTTLEGIYTLQEQSTFLKPIMDEYCDSCIVAGHSYGGGLAMQVALDYSNKIRGIASVAGTVAAPFQKLKWFNYAMSYSPAQWLVSQDLANSNSEMWRLQEDLPKMNSQLTVFKGKVAIVQGNADGIVDSKSASFLEQELVNAEVKMIIKTDMDHFVIWSNMELVMQALDWIEN